MRAGMVVCGLFFCLWAMAGAAAPVEKIDPSSYPSLSDEELGQFRWALRVADQPLDDFSHMEGIDQLGMTSYRYYLAFSAYFLALEQYHKLPACPEIVRPRMERLIEKMLSKPVWEFWAGVSRGVVFLEPKMNKPYPEERDPVVHRNIMYSGHVGHMIGLYESLYRDFRYEAPGSIAFVWGPDERYEYDYRQLNQVMYDQMRGGPRCVECEPNACFPECNQHPILSFMLYDRLHGANFMEASKDFMDFFLAKKMIDPQTHETAMLYLIKQDLTMSTQNPHYRNAFDLVITPAVSLGIVSLDSASANGWTGTFMHAWQPDYIERHYEYQKKRSLIEVDNERARLARTIWEPQLKYGFFAMLAAEMGDVETLNKLLKFADEKYLPVWEDGAMYYPYSSSRGATNLTGPLLAFARANPRNGVWKMHNQPFDDAHFQAPRVAGVDFPRMVLRRAIYDPDQKALIVTVEPGGAKGGTASLLVEQLDPAKTYQVTIDGAPAKTIQGAAESEVQAALDGRHDIVVRELTP